MRGLEALGFGAVVCPLTFGLMAVYVTGLLLLDRRQNGTHLAGRLPARSHDAINRLLRTHTVSTLVLMETIIEWIKCLAIKGIQVAVEPPGHSAAAFVRHATPLGNQVNQSFCRTSVEDVTSV